MSRGIACWVRLTALVAALTICAAPAAAHEGHAGHAPVLKGEGAFGAMATTSFAALAVPPGFTETIAFSGLTTPTNIEVAPDGRVFVAEKTGLIKVFDSLDDPTASVYADLRTQTHDFWDRGLLGLALDPAFTSGRPFVYALYAYNKEPGVTTFPRWADACPTPPGATGDGCVVSGRLSRLNGGVEQVLIEDWCQ
jgi:glucose/arabinose dehydrogenase